MSLRSKIALVLFLAVALFLGLDRVMFHMSFGARIRQADVAQVEKRMSRVLAGLEHEFDDLAFTGEQVRTRLGDPAQWGETVPLHAGPGSEPLDFVLVHDADGWVRQLRVLDPVSGEPLQLRELPTERLSVAHPITRGWEEGPPPAGIWVTERGALLVSASEIPRSGQAPLRLTVGRFLDERMLAGLRAQSGIDVDVILVHGRMPTVKQREILERAGASGAPIVEELDGQRLRVWAVVTDLGEIPVLLLRAEAPMELRPLWAKISQDVMLSSLAVAVLFPLAVLLLLQWIVTGPLSRLTSHAVTIGRAGDTNARLDLKRTDEIGQLADEFDRMLEELSRSREERARHARLAGMSELSAGVLHNIGNALNSVTTSSAIAIEKLRGVQSSQLEEVVRQLSAHRGELDEYLTSDERGQHLLAYLDALAKDYSSRVDASATELNSLGECIGHILAMISSLQSYGVRSHLEEIVLADQVEIALRMGLQATGYEADRLDIVRQYAGIPAFRTDPHRLREVLVNLIQNAVQAMERCGSSPMRLTLCVREEEPGLAYVEITDNGPGIPAEDRARVFSLGFSTRSNGSGLGLHISATRATEIGGKLTVAETELRKGTTFRLQLPLAS